VRDKIASARQMKKVQPLLTTYPIDVPDQVTPDLLSALRQL